MEFNNNVVHATEEYLRNQIAEKEQRISSLEQHVQNVTQRSYNVQSELGSIRDNMQAWTLEALSNREISETNAEEIAEICGFELTQEVEAEVSVTYYITVQVPVGEDAESIINDIDFDAIVYDTDKITNVSSSVDSVDI